MSNDGTTYGSDSDVSCMPEFDPTPSRIKFYFVYILKNKLTNSLYYGYTHDLEKRLDHHRINKKDFHLVYYEGYKSETDARNRERRLKHYRQSRTHMKSRIKNSLGELHL